MNKVIDDILVEATILGMMSEASSYEDFVNQKMPGLDNKQVKVGTALTYKTHKDFNQRQDKQKVYMDAVQNLQSGIESGQIKKSQVPDEYSAELKRKSAEPTKDTDKKEKEKDSARADQSTDDSDFAKVADDPPQKDTDKKKDKNKDSDGRRMIGDKDKTLRDVDSTTTEEFQRELEPSDEEFEKRNKKFANPIPPPAYKAPEGLLDNPNFPKKYVKALERLINTQPIGDAKRWGHYSDIPGGAGRVQAQAGELMTMMGASMSDEDFETFINSIDSHVDELVDKNPNMKKDSTRSVPKSWVKSAVNNRQAILNRVREEYPDAEIVATSWDTKDDVEALGLDDYEKNKGFSTDMYMKIRTADGDVLDEISLKKDVNVNFLNAGTGSFSKWDPDLPDEINPNVYARTQRENLAKTGKKLSGSIEKLLSSGKNTPEIKAFKALMKSKKIDFSQALEDTMAGKGSRAKSNVVQSGIAAMAAAGNKDAQKFMKGVDSRHRAYNAAAIEAIVSNDKLKEGMLKEIRSEFPLKAVGEGEETMAIGDLSLDRATMRNIFGTDDFDTIKQRLSAEPGPPPYLSYKAGPEGDIIPLAEIVVREDGVGYGANFKFEMTLDKRFAKKLREANEAVYGGSKNESVVYDHIQTLLEMARQV
tara:strand:+ start:2724 stop:4664 length:1941 start_codon:yes stop_codon:yes gene_type:complete